MSPTESELRAALHDGEHDDRPDVEHVLASARAHRGQRRVRVLSTAGAVVVVAAAAVGGTVLLGASSGGGHSADPVYNGPAMSAITASPTGSAAASPTGSASPSPAGALCPTAVPTQSLPRLGSAGSAPMFSAPVASASLCVYADATPGTATGVLLTGTQATELADSIEHASTSRLKIVCPDIASADTTLLAIEPVTADGTRLPAVVTDISVPNCNQPITNGTAVRYAWKPPAALAAKIAALH